MSRPPHPHRPRPPGSPRRLPRRPRRGRFVTLEGNDGAGKTTALARVRRCIEARGHGVVATREPGGTPLGEAIREQLLHTWSDGVDPLAEALLIFAARAQHLAAVIEPALAAGRWVLCDRFTDSTFAYQSGGRGLPESAIAALADLTHGQRWPDLTLYLDVPVQVGRQRIADRAPDRIEREDRAFFERVHDSYRQRAADIPRIATVDASRDLDAVGSDVDAIMDRFLDACETPSSDR